MFGHCYNQLQRLSTGNFLQFAHAFQNTILLAAHLCFLSLQAVIILHVQEC